MNLPYRWNNRWGFFCLTDFQSGFLFRGRVRVTVGVGGGFRVRVRVRASVKASVRARWGLGLIHFNPNLLELKLRPSGETRKKQKICIVLEIFSLYNTKQPCRQNIQIHPPSLCLSCPLPTLYVHARRCCLRWQNRSAFGKNDCVASLVSYLKHKDDDVNKRVSVALYELSR